MKRPLKSNYSSISIFRIEQLIYIQYLEDKIRKLEDITNNLICEHGLNPINCIRRADTCFDCIK